jgi:hypothetical protein
MRSVARWVLGTAAGGVIGVTLRMIAWPVLEGRQAMWIGIFLGIGLSVFVEEQFRQRNRHAWAVSLVSGGVGAVGVLLVYAVLGK